MSVPTPDQRIAQDQNHLAWDPAIPPVATVPSGSVVEFDCLDASFGQFAPQPRPPPTSGAWTSAGWTG